MPDIVTTPISYFEAVIEFERPNFQLLGFDRVAVVQALFDAFLQWGVKIDDLEIVSTGKTSEQGIKFKLPNKQSTFFFNASVCRFTRDNTSWPTAEETIKLLDAGLRIVIDAGHVKPATFKTVVALHIQPKNRPFTEILKKVVPPAMTTLNRAEPRHPQQLLSGQTSR